MRIGVMLRHYDQHGGGVKVYTQRLLRAILDLGTGHEFIFLYRNPGLIGTYRGEPGVEEVALSARSVLTWDQIAVPQAVRRHGIELLYNPKYSIPLMAGCPAVWVCHGLDWYVMPWASRRIDRLSHQFLVPRYAARAAAIIAVSEITRQHVMEFLPVGPDRVFTVYSGVDDVFRQSPDPARLQLIRKKYSLPQRFLLYAGAIYPPKNFTRLIRAYAQIGPERGIPLVVAGGENRFLSDLELKEPEALGIAEWVRWPGWVEQEDLAGFYSLADALLLPSLFESCGLPGARGHGGRMPGGHQQLLRNQGAGRGSCHAGRSGVDRQHCGGDTGGAGRSGQTAGTDCCRAGAKPGLSVVALRPGNPQRSRAYPGESKPTRARKRPQPASAATP